MKRKTLYAFGLSAVLGFSTLSGCGCGAVQTSEFPQQETSTVEEENTSSTVIEEVNSSKEIEIIEMDAIMYATTSVNERKEPSADSEKIGSLSMGEEVHVTGKTEDGLWMRIEEGDGEAFVASNYLSNEKPVVEEQPSTSELESTSSSGGKTTQTETPAPEQTTPPEQETVVYEPAPSEDNLPEAPAPDNPSAWESLGEPEYTDGSEFDPSGDLGNIGNTSGLSQSGATWQ